MKKIIFSIMLPALLVTTNGFAINETNHNGHSTCKPSRLFSINEPSAFEQAQQKFEELKEKAKKKYNELFNEQDQSEAASSNATSTPQDSSVPVIIQKEETPLCTDSCKATCNDLLSDASNAPSTSDNQQSELSRAQKAKAFVCEHKGKIIAGVVVGVVLLARVFGNNGSNSKRR